MEKIKYEDLKQYEAVHIFDYYDFPLFFISESPSKELFLNYYIEDIDQKIDKWLFGRITIKELKDLTERRLSVLTLLNRLYTRKRLYHLFINSIPSQERVEFELVEQHNFDEESFPEEDFYVEYDFVTKQHFVSIEEDVIDSSKFKMVLKDDQNSHDISLDLLLKVLGNLKNSLNEMANDIAEKLWGDISEYKINLRVDSLQPSSFGIYLKTEPTEADLFEVPEKSLSTLFEFIDDIQHKSPKEIEDQIDLDEVYSIETIKGVKNLLRDIIENDLTLALQAKTKKQTQNIEVKFDKESYSKIDILNKILKDKSQSYSEEFEVEGVLTSINTTYNKFRITTTTVGDVSGKMSREMFSELKLNNELQFKVPSAIKAIIKKEFVNDYIEEKQYEKYTLMKFEQPE